MDNLEETLKEVQLKPKEAEPLPVEKPIYEGLRKIEEKDYTSSTSIKYWM